MFLVSNSLATISGRVSNLHTNTYFWHTSHSTHKNDVAYITLADVSIFDSLFTGIDSFLDEVRGQRFKLGPRKLQVHVFGSTGIHGQERKIDVRLGKTELKFNWFANWSVVKTKMRYIYTCNKVQANRSL